MTLSCRVLRARKEYQCDDCNRYIFIGEKYVRLFGSSDDKLRNPRPHTLRQCKHCGTSTIIAKSEGVF